MAHKNMLTGWSRCTPAWLALSFLREILCKHQKCRLPTVALYTAPVSNFSIGWHICTKIYKMITVFTFLEFYIVMQSIYWWSGYVFSLRSQSVKFITVNLLITFTKCWLALAERTLTKKPVFLLGEHCTVRTMQTGKRIWASLWLRPGLLH
jgi:hypothetical protein